MFRKNRDEPIVILRDFSDAVEFLTILRLEKINPAGRSLRACAAAYFPSTGALLGILAVIINNLASTALPPTATGWVVATFLVIMTRALHLDGLADTFDAIGGGRSREEKLAIMKDAHIGTFGVLSLILAVLFQTSALSYLSLPMRNFALLLMTVLSRWSLNIGIALFPCARPEGKAHIFFVQKTTKTFALATASVILFLTLIPTGFCFPGTKIRTAWAFNACILFLVSLFTAGANKIIRRALGGLTGDTLGAVCALNEYLILLSVVVFSKIQPC